MGSIDSSQQAQSSVGGQVRRPSYLQKLTKSPLLTSMAHHGVPRSIVNRIISEKEQQDRKQFRKYGVPPPKEKAVGNPTEKYNVPLGPLTSMKHAS